MQVLLGDIRNYGDINNWWRRQFPDPALQILWVTNTAEFGKQYGTRGVSHGIMPHFADMLTAEQIKAIVDYERSL